MEDLLNKLEEEKENRFLKPWSKLEKGNKLNRLNFFIDEKDISVEDGVKLKKLLNNLFKKGMFSKSSDIDYCTKTAKIITIKNLNYDEEKKEYTFNLPKKIVKPINKSKSKVDRHFSRSKENK